MKTPCVLAFCALALSFTTACAEETSEEKAEPVHEMDGKTLVTVPKGTPDVAMRALIEGILAVNDKGCFTVNDRVIVTTFDATITPQAKGISVPGLGTLDLGTEVSGSGGILNEAPKGFEFCAESDATEFVQLSGV